MSTQVFSRRVLAEDAKAAARRLIAKAFNRTESEHPHFSIPTRESDDDVLLLDYIEQAEAERERSSQCAEELAEAAIANERGAESDFRGIIAKRMARYRVALEQIEMNADLAMRDECPTYEVLRDIASDALQPPNLTPYGDCSGCTDPRSEGTHQAGTHQHPLQEPQSD